MMVDSSRGAKGILLTQIKQDFVTPANAATLIVFLGVIMFLVKLTKYVFEKKKH